MKKIAISSTSRSTLSNEETAIINADGLKVGLAVTLQLKGEYVHGKVEDEYLVKSITPKPGYMGGGRSTVVFEKRFFDVRSTGKMPVAPVAAPSTNYKDRVSNQYAAIETAKDNLLRECVKFGALLTEVSYFLGEARGRGNDGEGLKAWLAENCPEVNYSTAINYKALATKCVKMIGGGSQAVAALQDKTLVQEPGTGDTIDVDGDFIRKRDELFAEVKSRRELEQTYFDFMARDGKRRPGRPKGSGAGAVEPRAKTAAVKAAEAEAEMRELIGRLGAYLTRGGKVGMLTAQARDDFHRALVDYAQQLAEMM